MSKLEEKRTDRPLGADEAARSWRARRRWLIVAAVVVAVPFVAVFAFATIRPVKVVPRMGLAPGFSLVDQTGARLTSEDTRGSVTVYTFGYTRCGARCAAADTLFRELQGRLDEAEPGDVPIRLVTVSFDPEHDSPEVLAAAAAERGADPEIWTFATGEPAMLKNMIGGGFGVYYAAEEDGFAFDPAVIIVDGLGIVRAEYRVGTPEADDLLADLRLVTKEARVEGGLSRLAYEAAHLFACYPR
jgi:protein SCO1